MGFPRTWRCYVLSDDVASNWIVGVCKFNVHQCTRQFPWRKCDEVYQNSYLDAACEIIWLRKTIIALHRCIVIGPEKSHANEIRYIFPVFYSRRIIRRYRFRTRIFLIYLRVTRRNVRCNGAKNSYREEVRFLSCTKHIEIVTRRSRCNYGNSHPRNAASSRAAPAVLALLVLHQPCVSILLSPSRPLLRRPPPRLYPTRSSSDSAHLSRSLERAYLLFASL